MIFVVIGIFMFAAFMAGRIYERRKKPGKVTTQEILGVFNDNKR